MIVPKGGSNFRTRSSDDGNPYHQEHQDLMASIRAGKPLNAAKDVAETTLTGIMGREAAYSGQTIEWDDALNSKTRLGPVKITNSVRCPSRQCRCREITSSLTGWGGIQRWRNKRDHSDRPPLSNRSLTDKTQTEKC